MTEPFRDLEELRTLLDALCDESATDVQLRRIEQLVLSSPEAEACYVQTMSLHADLVRHFGVLPGTAEQSLRDRLTGVPLAPTPPSRAPRRRLMAWGSLGVTAAAAALLVGLWLGKPPDPPTSPGPEPTDNTVAILWRAPEAVWEDDIALRPGSPLPPLRLRLKSGFAHIEFYSGATVLLEGPADFHLLSRTEAYCARGKLRAIVPAQAHGFTIGTPRLDLVDRGTEFGVAVADGDATEVHVFQGKVELHDAGASGRPRGELTTGLARRFDGPGRESQIQPDPSAFQTAVGMARLSAAENERLQRRWLTASQDLRRDPSLLVYYTFQSSDPLSRTLLDRARGRARPRDGAIVGCSWDSGRWPGKQALEFKRVSDRVRFSLGDALESVTLMAWVRVDALPNRNNSLMMSDGWEEGELHWQIGDTGKLILGVQSRPKGRGAHYHAPEAITPDRFGRWAHLAVVYDRDNGRVSHYLDGRPVSQEPILFDLPLKIGNAEIGNWNVAEHHNTTVIRFFTGCIDEFMLFSRALADEEVERFSVQGRPPS